MHKAPYDKKIPRYDGGGDAVQRLDHTIVFIRTNNNRVPVRLMANGGMDFIPQRLDRKDPDVPAHLDGNSDLIELESPELGYVNRPEKGEYTVYYVSRTPVRRFHQGLHQNNVIFQTPFNARNTPWPVTDLQFAKMLKNDYPTLTEATKAIQSDDVDAIAFHRKLCLGKHPDAPDTIRLYYMNEPAGFCEINDGRLHVWRLPKYEKFAHLMSTLAQAGAIVET